MDDISLRGAMCCQRAEAVHACELHVIADPGAAPLAIARALPLSCQRGLEAEAWQRPTARVAGRT